MFPALVRPPGEQEKILTLILSSEAIFTQRALEMSFTTLGCPAKLS